MHSTLLLLQAPQKWQLGLSVSIPRICSNCARTQLFSVSYSFFVFPYLRRVVSSAAGSQVPACLSCGQFINVNSVASLDGSPGAVWSLGWDGLLLTSELSVKEHHA